MTERTSTAHGARRRNLALMVAGALVLSLLPLVGWAQPEPVENPADACPDDVNPPAPFTDRLQIPQVHRLNVDCAFNNDIALGFADQTYRPRDIVQRDQFASFMVRTMQAADVDLPAPSDQGFTDISGNVHEDNINIIAQTGITVGTSATTYSPTQRLRRDQIASFILRAAAYIEDVPLGNLQRETGPFTDVPATNVHSDNINGARALNLTIGRSAGTYAPTMGTRRDQMASFLVRLLAALSEGPLIPAEDRAETLVLTPQTATNPVASSHTVTATVRDDDEALLADANVRFEVYRDAEGDGTFTGPVAQGTQRTNAQGESGFTYSGPANPGSDRIVACAVRPNETCAVVDQDAATDGTQFTGEPTVNARVDDTATKNWRERTPDERTDDIVVDDGDLDATNPLGDDHTIAVTAVDAGDDPVAGANVRFEVYRAPTAAGTFTGPVEQDATTTDAQGRASFTYTGPNEPAVDRIVICVPSGGSCQVTDEDTGTAGTQFTGDPTVGAEPHAVATKRWQAETEPVDEIVIDEGDLDAVNPLGDDHTIAVTARDDDDDPVAGASVRFEVYRAPTAGGQFAGPVEEHATTTDAQGRATFTYTGPNEPAVDRIVICVPDNGTCGVTAPFTGDPTVAADPHAVATKRWAAPTWPAESLTASAYGLDVNVLGIGLIDELPSVAIDLPPPDEAEVSDEVLGLPLEPLADAAAIEVTARGDIDEGFAQGEAVAVDLQVLPELLTDDALITADLIRAVSTSTCPEPGTLEQASAGSQFVNVEVAGLEIPLNPPPNTALEVPGVAEIVVNEVVPDAGNDDDNDAHGFTVRALRVTLLEGTGGEVIVAEAHSSVVCADEPTVASAAGATDAGDAPVLAAASDRVAVLPNRTPRSGLRPAATRR